MTFLPGNTYRFDLSDDSTNGHPFRFDTSGDGSGTVVYTEGVTSSGTQGDPGAYRQIAVTQNTPTNLFYRCTNHSGMGNSITVDKTSPLILDGNTGQISGSRFLFTGGKISGSSVEIDVENVKISGSSVDIATPKFFLGGGGQFISGSNQNIEISSSNFHLQPDGDVVMSGTVTATTGELGGFAITPTAISESNNRLILRSDGRITASFMQMTGEVNIVGGSAKTHLELIGEQTASLNTSVVSIGAQTASLDTSVVSIGAQTASLDASVVSIGEKSASLDTSVVSIGAQTASLDASVVSIGAQTASLDTSVVSIGATTASIQTVTASLQVASASMASTAALTATGLDIFDSGSNRIAQFSGNVTIGKTSFPENNVFIDEDSVEIRRGSQVSASFGSTTTIGPTTDKHVKITSDALEIKTDSDTTVLSASAAGLEMEGTVRATAGEIGGFTINSTEISASGLLLKSSGQITGSAANLSGSSVDIRTPKFFLGGSGQFVSGSNGNIEISSSKFHVKPDGDIVVRKVNADDGTIGGFKIANTFLTSSAGSGFGILIAEPDTNPTNDFNIDEDGALGISFGLHRRPNGTTYTLNTSNMDLDNATNYPNLWVMGSATDNENIIFRVGKSGGEGIRFENEKIEVSSSAFLLGDKNSNFVSGSNGNIEISSSKFHVKPDGDIVVRKVDAVEGSISGFSVENNKLLGRTVSDFSGTVITSSVLFTPDVENTGGLGGIPAIGITAMSGSVMGAGFSVLCKPNDDELGVDFRIGQATGEGIATGTGGLRIVAVQKEDGSDDFGYSVNGQSFTDFTSGSSFNFGGAGNGLSYGLTGNRFKYLMGKSSGAHLKFDSAVNELWISSSYQNMETDIGKTVIYGNSVSASRSTAISDLNSYTTSSLSHLHLDGLTFNTATSVRSALLGAADGEQHSITFNRLLYFESTQGGESMRLSRNSEVVIAGALSKGSGTFRISHPDPKKNEKYYLQHSFVESPTRGDNIYRWQIDVKEKRHTIKLPDYYKHLNENDMVWINAVKHFGKAYGEVNVEQTELTIHTHTIQFV